MRFDPQFFAHPKVARLSDGAFRMWVAMICRSVALLTDGVLAPEEVRLLIDGDADALAAELEAAGLVNRTDGLLVLHDFADWQMTRAQVEAAREATRERVRKHRGNAVTPVRRARHGFDEFWALYPRKVGRIAAEKAWKAATDVATPEEILDGLRRALGGWQGTDRRYIPHPSTWLNQGRWMDEPEPVTLPQAQQTVKAVLAMRRAHDT